MAFLGEHGTGRQSAHPGFFAAGMLCLAAASVFPLAGCDSRASLTPDLVVEAFTNDEGNPVTNPKDVTSEKCGVTIPCKEAVQADETAVYSFEKKEDAAAFARALGNNGFHDNWIVLEYENAAQDTDEAEVSYAATLDGMWSSD